MSKSLHIQTPVFESQPLTKISGKKILLKMENYQPTGSFKIRGIGRLAQELVAQGHDHLVASSGGNAGYAVSYAARRLGVKATVFVPQTTHAIYLKYLESQNADVQVKGAVWDEAHHAAMAFVEQIQAGYIPPFDHPTLWAGHSTMIDEVINQCEKPDAIIAAVGGGGLMCGIIEGLERHHWSDVALFSVETEGAASFAATLKAGKLVTLDKIQTIATSLGAKRVTPRLFEWSKTRKITPLIVSDHATALACRYFSDDHRALVEPACGAALSAIYDLQQFPALATPQTILVIVCGGIGISIELLEKYITQTSTIQK